MGRRERYSRIIIAVVAVSALGSVYALHLASRINPLPIDSILPSASVRSITNDSLALDSLIQSKSVILWFSTTCPLCWEHVFRFDSTIRRRSGDHNIIGISSDSPDALLRFKVKHALDLPMFHMERDQARYTFHIGRFPTIFFINEQRRIARIISPLSKRDSMYCILRSFLR